MPLLSPKFNFSLTHKGWLRTPQDGVQRAPSPNHDARPAEQTPYLLVIHNISLPPNQFHGEAVVQFFQNQLDFDAHPWFENIRGMKVSAHFLIRRNGHTVQFVSTLDRAWHAGVSSFMGIERCNDYSIGIELEGADTIAYTSEQYQALVALSAAIHAHHPLKAICGHEHIAPGRKTDPGPAFDWDNYAKRMDLPSVLIGPL